ncbi:MAG: AraC family transcriptional regulator [Ilumatobacteraceae bacterium]|nr:AraC family transcriptional regulator [Ilumatobacteraceae bacterium]
MGPATVADPAQRRPMSHDRQVPRPAFSFVRTFEPEPERTLVVDHHYLLCASRGVIRLTADRRTWSLPPARAALIAAGHPIEVTIVQAVTSASVLFAPTFTAAPEAPLTVIELSPLARSLVAECGRWGDDDEPLPPLATSLFEALAGVVRELACDPSPTAMPTGRSRELRHALELTAAEMAAEPLFDDIAARVGLTTRSLARRFEDELGMTWRAALRRLRILRSIELLAADDASVAAAAFAVGYGSLSAFNAAFKDVTGRTPTAYRASFRP